MTRIMLRPLASPLAFFAFGAGSLLLSMAAFVFPPLAPSSVLAVLSRETLGATIMDLISFFWLANGMIDLSTPPSSTNAPQGLLALSLAAILLLVGISAVLGKPLLGLVIAPQTAVGPRRLYR